MEDEHKTIREWIEELLKFCAERAQIEFQNQDMKVHRLNAAIAFGSQPLKRKMRKKWDMLYDILKKFE